MNINKLVVDDKGLAELLSCPVAQAVKIASLAGAQLNWHEGPRLWSVDCLRQFLPVLTMH